jgi:hypothetical protein
LVDVHPHSSIGPTAPSVGSESPPELSSAPDPLLSASALLSESSESSVEAALWPEAEEAESDVEPLPMSSSSLSVAEMTQPDAATRDSTATKIPKSEVFNMPR